jgi:hypothetical protein
MMKKQYPCCLAQGGILNKIRVTMKKTLCLILGGVGIAGMFLSAPVATSQADPVIVLDSRPDFVYVPPLGFSVSVGGRYDVLFFDDTYYVRRNGKWYSASRYRGPWDSVSKHDLPDRIRQFSWEEIRRLRDREYRDHDRQYWEERNRRERYEWEQRDRLP